MAPPGRWASLVPPLSPCFLASLLMVVIVLSSSRIAIKNRPGHARYQAVLPEQDGTATRPRTRPHNAQELRLPGTNNDPRTTPPGYCLWTLFYSLLILYLDPVL